MRAGREARIFDGWEQVRLDINPHVAPDIVGSMVDMPQVETGSFDAVFAQHSLEHLDLHRVRLALREFRRVVRPIDGFALIIVPDLQVAAEYIVAGKADAPCYTSASGPITPLDMIYGHSGSIAEGDGFMAHRTGFTAQSLINQINAAGFPFAGAVRNHKRKEVWAEARNEQGKPDLLARLKELDQTV